MNKAAGDYRDWRGFDYVPAVDYMLPDALIPHLAQGSRVLDIGCGVGHVSLFLAKRGMSVIGLDIKECAMETARQNAEQQNLSSLATFVCADILSAKGLGIFDAVIMIRVLTCFSNSDDWTQLLERVQQLVAVDGLVYINDFLLDEQSPVYGKRYESGRKMGWRDGNFSVNNPDGGILFIAHHHTESELEIIRAPYETVELRFRESLSMNGNPCKMFEFVGRARKRPNNGSLTFPADNAQGIVHQKET